MTDVKSEKKKILFPTKTFHDFSESQAVNFIVHTWPLDIHLLLPVDAKCKLRPTIVMKIICQS